MREITQPKDRTTYQLLFSRSLSYLTLPFPPSVRLHLPLSLSPSLPLSLSPSLEHCHGARIYPQQPNLCPFSLSFCLPSSLSDKTRTRERERVRHIPSASRCYGCIWTCVHVHAETSRHRAASRCVGLVHLLLQLGSQLRLRERRNDSHVSKGSRHMRDSVYTA